MSIKKESERAGMYIKAPALQRIYNCQMKKVSEGYPMTARAYRHNNLKEGLSTMHYVGGFPELFMGLQQLPSMAVETWLEVFGQAVQFLVETRQECYLASYICQLASERSSYRSTIKYFYLMDKLMRTRRSFTPHFESILIDLYVLVFVSFWQRGFHSSVEELKILRKMWLGTVSAAVLQTLRQRLMELLTTDVEVGFSRMQIDTIERYYRSQLKMTEWQVRQHLPTMTQKEMEDRYTQDSIRYVQYPVRMPIMPVYPSEPVHSFVIAGPQRHYQYNKRRRDYLVDEYKRPRKVRISENYFGGQRVVPVQQPLINKQPVVANLEEPSELKSTKVSAALSKLSVLRGLGRWRCQKCGVCFGEERAYDYHLRFHFYYNLQRYDMKVRRLNVQYRCSNLSLYDWQTHSKQNSGAEELLESYSVDVDEVLGQTTCNFCGYAFKRRLIERKGTWAYVNCIEVVTKEAPKSGKIVVHKSCFDVLQEGLESSQ